ncbi:hypothetical protein Ancab_013115 [Ancistrocladus abbreviatus]
MVRHAMKTAIKEYEWLNDCYVGEVKSADSIPGLHKSISEKGYHYCRMSAMGEGSINVKINEHLFGIEMPEEATGHSQPHRIIHPSMIQWLSPSEGSPSHLSSVKSKQDRSSKGKSYGQQQFEFHGSSP